MAAVGRGGFKKMVRSGGSSSPLRGGDRKGNETMSEQGYGVYYNGPQTGSPAQDLVSLEGVVGLSDQIDAAVRDVQEAWRYFCYGSSPALQVETSPPYSNDKLQHAHSSLFGSTQRLADLAREIRQRA